MTWFLVLVLCEGDRFLLYYFLVKGKLLGLMLRVIYVFKDEKRLYAFVDFVGF